MAVLRFKTNLVFIAAIALVGLTGASTVERASDQVAAVPVLTASRTVGAALSVCMYPGARPQTYRVLSISCRGGAERCTAFVALGDEEAEVLLAGYDLANPPVEATGSVCERPVFRSEGILQRPADRASPPR